VQWAVESIGAACTYAYVEADGKTHITTPFNLGDPYYNRNLPVIEMQVRSRAAGGLLRAAAGVF
jgi:hypothetical protein